MTYKIQPKPSKFTFYALFGLVIFLSYKIAASFLVSVLMGWLIAHSLEPIQKGRWLKNFKPRHAAYITFAGLILVFVLPLALFVSSLIRQAIQLKDFLVYHEMTSLHSLVESMAGWPIASYFIQDPARLQNEVEIWTSEIGTFVSSFALNQATEIPSLLVQTLFVLLSCFVFLIEGDRFTSWLTNLIPLKGEIKASIKKSFTESSKNAAWATLAASGAQSATILTGFLILNVPAAVLAAGATFIFSFVPIVGSSPVWILGAIYLYLQGSFIKFALMICFGVAAGLVDNIMRAFVLTGPHGLHPLVGLVAVFGGIQVFGLFGVLIGPIVIALLITMCEVWPQIWDE